MQPIQGGSLSFTREMHLGADFVSRDGVTGAESVAAGLSDRE